MSIVATRLTMAQNAGSPLRKQRATCGYSTGTECVEWGMCSLILHTWTEKGRGVS